MANFDFDFPQELFTQLQRMEQNTDELQKTMLKESAPILVDEMKKNLKIIGAEDTGQLIKSIKARTPNKDRTGTWQIFVGPQGYDNTKYYYDKYGHKYKLTNAAKLVFYEYGTKNQTPKPSIQKAVNNAEDKIYNKMQEVYNREVGT